PLLEVHRVAGDGDELAVGEVGESDDREDHRQPEREQRVRRAKAERVDELLDGLLAAVDEAKRHRGGLTLLGRKGSPPERGFAPRETSRRRENLGSAGTVSGPPANGTAANARKDEVSGGTRGS